MKPGERGSGPADNETAASSSPILLPCTVCGGSHSATVDGEMCRRCVVALAYRRAEQAREDRTDQSEVEKAARRQARRVNRSRVIAWHEERRRLREIRRSRRGGAR